MNNIRMNFCTTFLVFLFLSTTVNAQISSNTSNRFRQAGITVQDPVSIRDFQVRMLDGSVKSLKDYGNQVVFLNFWATWCPPCRGEMPSMEALYKHFKSRNFAMLAIDLQEDPKDVAAFMRQMGLSFPAGIDSSGRISDMYGIRAIPTTYIIKNGYIIASTVGSRDWNTPQVFSAFEALLNE